MKVSVIMCAYNVEAFVERAIQSMLRQTYTNWELIISDDLSTDRTLEVIRPYLSDTRIRLYENGNNVGYVANKNRAFSYATGDLLTQLDADDTCTPDRLEKQVEVFAKNPGINICGSGYNIVDIDDNVIEAKHTAEDQQITELLLEYPFWFPGLMFRASVVKEFGLFPEYFNGIYGDDHYWTMKVNKKYPIYLIKDALYNYRINPGSLTNVLDKPRKLIAQDIIAELHRQISATGADWLSTGQEQKMREFEEQLFKDKDLMARRYRVWAAKAIDKKNWHQAKALLKSCLATGKAGIMGYRTLFYYLKSRYLRLS